MNNEMSNVKVVFEAFKQGVREGKVRYILKHIFGILIGFEMFFWLRVPELVTDISYKFYTDNTLDFHSTMNPIYILGLTLMVFQLIKNVYAVLGVRLRRDIRSEFELGLIKKTSLLPWEDFENHEFQMKMETVNRRGSEAYQRLSVELIESMTGSIMYIAIYVAVVMRLSVVIGLVFLGASILYYIIGFIFGNKVYKMIRETNKASRKLNYLFRAGEQKQGHQDILVNRLVGYISNKWDMLNTSYKDKAVKSENRIKLYILIPNLFFVLIAGWLMYEVIGEIENGNQSIGYFGLIIATIINYKNTMYTLSVRIQWNKRDINIYRDCIDIYKRASEMNNNEKTLPNDFIITFEDVTYKYIQGEVKALNRFNISITSQETVAIVGVNGSGKTTFVNLLMELTKRYDGRIKVNDYNIDDELGIIRNSASCIYQDFSEYQVTIRDNIRLGDLKRDIEDKEVWTILEKVGLKAFVEELPDDINTMLGQINKGTDLSKGQWQRLAVARLLANKEAKIWILDEPTAYLDPIAEIEMYEFIYSLKEDRSVIFISHRLGFAKQADRILVFKDGAVIEEGTHKELLDNMNGEYSRMYLKQKKWYE